MAKKGRICDKCMLTLFPEVKDIRFKKQYIEMIDKTLAFGLCEKCKRYIRKSQKNNTIIKG